MKLTAVLSAAAVAVVALGVTTVMAQKNPIAERQELMKHNGREAKLAAQMIKHQKPFDLAAAKRIFATFEETSQKMPGLFPADSKTGHKTTVSPKIWEHMADFKARFEKLGADAKKAKGSVTDLASFRTAFGGIGKQCGGCHREYRIKRD
jgi:cytochrome c556